LRKSKIKPLALTSVRDENKLIHGFFVL